jgi:hypothetical protein
MLLEHYGAAARDAAAQCAGAALADERSEDHHFWTAALDELHGMLDDAPEFIPALAGAGENGFP